MMLAREWRVVPARSLQAREGQIGRLVIPDDDDQRRATPSESEGATATKPGNAFLPHHGLHPPPMSARRERSSAVRRLPRAALAEFHHGRMPRQSIYRGPATETS